jgi:hypothetical protein
VIPIRAVWTAPGNDVIQGNNNVLISRMMNTLKRELQNQQDQLLVDHQDERIVDGGASATIMFHYLINPSFGNNGANITTPIYHFDANEGQAGTANWVLDQRRDFTQRRGY